jgi:hypothetical protein
MVSESTGGGGIEGCVGGCQSAQHARKSKFNHACVLFEKPNPERPRVTASFVPPQVIRTMYRVRDGLATATEEYPGTPIEEKSL